MEFFYPIPSGSKKGNKNWMYSTPSVLVGENSKANMLPQLRIRTLS
jgi:hypothetical protein